MRFTKTLIAAAFALGASSFAQAQDSATQQAPTDPEIAHVVVTANTIDVEAGKLAQTKAQNKEVKALAKQMVTDHTAVNKQASDLAKKLGVTPKDNETSKSLASNAKANMDKMKGLKGAAFDKAYVDNEVTFHQSVLDALDKTLIPNAKNEELKALMTKVRPNIAAHLEHAKQIQTTLNK